MVEQSTIERLEDALDAASEWALVGLTTLMGIAIVYLLRERASVAPRGDASHARPTPPGATARPRPRAHVEVDPRKFVHTVDECPLRGCSRCTRPKT
jgi:hypothetical protein